MSNATLKGKKDDIARIVGELDEQFDAWEKNQKTGAAQKIDEKKEHFCPLCGSKADKEVDAGQVDAMKDGMERARKESFSEMEEQVKFVKALEDTIKQRNEELEMESMENDFSDKRADKLTEPVGKPKRRAVKTEPSPAVPKKIAVPKSIWVHDDDNKWKAKWKAKEKHRRKVEVIHRVPLPGDSPQVIHRVPLPGEFPGVINRVTSGDFPETSGGASWPYYGMRPKQKFKFTRTML